MGILHPLKIIIRNLPEIKEFTVLDYPFDASRGSHKVTIEEEIFIDRDDFRLIDSEVSF